MKKSLVAAILAVTAAPAVAANPYVLGAGQGGPNTAQYHSYDGLICTDCHTLHNSENGVAVTMAGGTKYAAGSTNRELLYRADWTDMCLSCHQEGKNTSATAALPSVTNSGWTAPIVMTDDGAAPVGANSMPGGDFYWSSTDPKKGHNPAYTMGANLNSVTGTSFFMAADPDLKGVPPGGTSVGNITDGEWSCHSCHGMHSRFSGSYTAYRQLKRKVNGKMVTGKTTTAAAGVETYLKADNSPGNAENTAAGYEAILSNSRGNIQGVDANTFGQNYVALRKDGNPLEGANLFAAYGDDNKNVYRGGFSSFCSACHGDFHGTATTEGATDAVQTAGIWSRHPTNIDMNDVDLTAQPNRKYGIKTYKVAITNQQGINPNPPGYDFRYPLIQPDQDFTVKSTPVDSKDANDPATALKDSRLSCLTCHKAHASNFENMVRWDASAHSFIKVGDADVEGVTYDPATGSFLAQGSLGDNPAFGCGKCHQKGGTNAYVKSGF